MGKRKQDELSINEKLYYIHTAKEPTEGYFNEKELKLLNSIRYELRNKFQEPSIILNLEALGIKMTQITFPISKTDYLIRYFKKMFSDDYSRVLAIVHSPKKKGMVEIWANKITEEREYDY